MKEFDKKIKELPLGSYFVYYKDKKYLLNKSIYSHNRVIKIFAKCLSNSDIVSANYFLTIKSGLLKPCEMEKAKVIDFIKALKIG